MWCQGFARSLKQSENPWSRAAKSDQELLTLVYDVAEGRIRSEGVDKHLVPWLEKHKDRAIKRRVRE